MQDRRPNILFISPNWPLGKAFGGQLRASHIERALKQIGNVTLTVVSSDPENEEHAPKSMAQDEIKPPVFVQTSPNRGLRQKLRWAFDPRYMNVHGCVASQADRERISSYITQYDLIWILNSRIPNILQRWSWPHTHLDVDDIPSTYVRTVAENGAGLAKRWKARSQQILLKRRERLFEQRFTTVSV